ncbi:MAG TPA: quinone oxidoreductase [Thermoanaerobaculia bacterium]|jgi:NADPH2:quinone reductase|nr:quinone oxidoreductase [Thermoanaerobaculia bacterium]
MKALCFSRFGGPEVLEIREIPDPEPRPGHAIVRTQAIGLNFADVYRRKGNYHLAGEPPWIAGYEGVGVVESTAGEGPFRPGDRVAFADSPFANAELVSVPFDKLIPLPADIPAEMAAALLLQGLTAQYLTRDSHAVRPGEWVLVHAAAGGVGLLLVQIATTLGARVLGLTSSAGKASGVLEAGADAAALYSEDWVGKARELSGNGVDVAYDSVGSTLLQSFEAVRTGGHVVFYGMAGGDPPPVDPRMLMDTSKTLTGGDLWNVLRTAEDRRSRAAELFEQVRSGRLQVHIAARFPLSEGAAAHAFLESRRSSGKVLLIP